MQTYIAFLRGINVGGQSLIKMEALRSALQADGLTNVRTYIQSGNVLFETELTDKTTIAQTIADSIRTNFRLEVSVAIFTGQEWQQIIANAPQWWGTDDTWKHNILIMIRPYDDADVLNLKQALKPGIEELQIGDGVLYQSIAWDAVGKGVTGSKLVANPLYKKITIRNYNTATKIGALLT